MNLVYLLLLVAACACFAIAAFTRAGATARVNLVAAGLTAWVLVPLLQHLIAVD